MQISTKTDFGGDAPPQNAASLVKWAEVLLRPELNRIEEACELLQQVAAGMASAGEGPTVLSGGPHACYTQGSTAFLDSTTAAAELSSPTFLTPN